MDSNKNEQLTFDLAEADPSKEFFIEMITKDISLIDCILDLLDNCIEAAVKEALASETQTSEQPLLEKKDVSYDLKPYYCKITISENSFTIEDNCGGIPYSKAVHEIFHFGRKRIPDSSVPFPIGLYGIGMKRAMFKIGSSILINSNVSEEEGFKVSLDVPKWKVETGWTIPIYKTIQNNKIKGTSIQVTELFDGVKSDFGTSAFVTELMRNIQQHYFIFLHKGFNIEVNNNKVEKIEIELLSSNLIIPANYTIELKVGKEENAKDVEVKIIAGMIAIPPNDTSADAEFDKTNMTGWFIVCNDRVVLAADTSERTGWGVTVGKWHPQYNGFLGMIMFNSKDPSILPWTTTKKDIDTSNELFISVKSIMKDLAKNYIKYTGSRRLNLDLAEEIEGAAKLTKVDKLSDSPALILPPRSTFKANDENKTKDITISYKKSKEDINAIAEAFDLPLTGSYADNVGSKTFDYYFKYVLDQE